MPDLRVGAVITTMRYTPFDKWVRPLYGQPCWGLNFDRQLNLSMNFGQPTLPIREPYESTSPSSLVQRMASQRRVTIRGEWWLWLRLCHWRLSLNDVVLATGSSSLRRIENAMSHLDGQKLAALSVNAETGWTRFTFDLGGQLECRRFRRESDDELWLLYRPRRYVLPMYANGCYHHGRGTDF